MRKAREDSGPWTPDPGLTRRRFGQIAGGALGWLAVGGCRLASGALQGRDGRLAARPRSGVTTTAKAGAIGLERSRDAILRLPAQAGSGPVPLIVLLHGAGGSSDGILRRLGSAAEEAGAAVLAPDSRGASWDAIRSGFGSDVVYVNRALERVFDTVAIDPARVAIGGFSDGATYALSLGLINGDLFTHIVAFSPGFIVEGEPYGKPKVFVSHGTNDEVLPIDRCSRVIVPGLKRQGYDVTFREFAGEHEVPPDIAREGMEWLAAR